jgi:hypothetical protein
VAVLGRSLIAKAQAPRRRIRLLRSGLSPAAGGIRRSAQTLRRLRLLGLVTGIFEKELLLLLYYFTFSFIAGAFPAATIQALFFAAGTLAQVLLKVYRKAPPWNHFVLVCFYLAGTLLNHGGNTLGYGLLGFLFLVSGLSALYDRFLPRLKHPLLLTLLGMAHSAVVFTAFPILYSLFLLKKKGLSLSAFFGERDHFLVFLGYSTFYLSVVLNRQLLSFQNNLLRKWCRLQNPGLGPSQAQEAAEDETPPPKTGQK